MRENSGSPLYMRIADSLQAKIVDGTYGPGDQLPTKADLCAEWGAAVNTVERGLKELRERGLIETFHGVGSFVRAEAKDNMQPDIDDLQARLARLEEQMAAVLEKLQASHPDGDRA